MFRVDHQHNVWARPDTVRSGSMAYRTTTRHGLGGTAHFTSSMAYKMTPKHGLVGTARIYTYTRLIGLQLMYS